MEIFISAGEASGDLHGSRLARAIRSIAPETRLSCLGGPLLQNSGVPLIVDHRSISVVGASEVLRHAREIFRSWRKITSHLKSNPPDVVVLIDFPDFNFLLGRLAKRIGSKVFYYISPQIWAWREGRVRTIRRMVDRMAVILPFEEAFYLSHGINVDFVGHPLLDILADVPARQECEAKYRHSEGPIIGLLPGSRRSEIDSLFEPLMDSASIISGSYPNAEFLIPVAPSLNHHDIESRAARWNLPLRVVPGDTYGVMNACDLIITASGTVTLEAAILGTPMIIVYRVSALSAKIGKMLIRARFAGLPNLIANRPIAPELLQDQVRPEIVSMRALQMIRNPALLHLQRQELGLIKQHLGTPGISDRVARLVLETGRKA